MTDHTNIDYAAIVAAQKAEAARGPTLDQIVRANLPHFAGFAQAGAKLGLACDQIAAAEGCNPDSLRRVFLGQIGKWSEFCSRSKAPNRQDDISPKASASSLDEAGRTGVSRVW